MNANELEVNDVFLACFVRLYSGVATTILGNSNGNITGPEPYFLLTLQDYIKRG